MIGRLTRRPFGSTVATFYELVAAPAVHNIVTPVLENELDSRPVGRVADIGCGSGVITSRLTDAKRMVVGVDPSIAQLRRVRRKNPVPCVAGPADSLPLQSEAFGAVVSSCAIKHWSSRSSGLNECLRILETDGLLVIVEIDAGLEGDLLRFTNLTRVPLGFRRLYVFAARRTFVRFAPTAAELTADLIAAGLTDIRASRIDKLPFLVVTGVRRSASASRREENLRLPNPAGTVADLSRQAGLGHTDL